MSGVSRFSLSSAPGSGALAAMAASALAVSLVSMHIATMRPAFPLTPVTIAPQHTAAPGGQDIVWHGR